MKHGEVSDRLGPYLEGDLPLQQRALVDAHLDACPSCAEELKELRATIGLLRSLPEIEAPTNLASRVMARVQEGEGQPTAWTRLLDILLRSRPLALGAAAAGAVVLAVLAPGWLARQTEAPQTAAVPASQSDASDLALLSRIAPLSVWTAQAPLVRRPLGSSAPSDEPVGPLPPEAAPPAGPAPGPIDSHIDELLRDPGRFVDELSEMPLAERDRELSALLEEVIRAGRAAEVVQTLRMAGDRRADAIAEGLERTASAGSPP
ncbi:MAG TPA: hypothetical protein DEP35_22585 [Deltaproteobacteria bacterium]|nr:hypothetical protein [Deltaproteobacteria bacterium]